MAANDEKQEDEERYNINKLLRRLREEEKEEDEARPLLEEVKINLEEPQARASATEKKIFGRLWASTCGRGPGTVGEATALHHGQNMTDVAEQRHTRSSL